MKTRFVLRSVGAVTACAFVIFQDAAAASDSLMANFAGQHQLGVRIGAWVNVGDTPPERVQDNNETLTTDIGDASVFLEGEYTHRLNRLLGLGFSVGVVNRGDVVYTDAFGDNFYGSLVIYPILVKVKVYPLAAALTRLQPYVGLGGGLYYGRHDIQLTTSPFYFSELDEQSKTKLSYTVTAGVDYPLAGVIGLELSTAYFPAKFSSELVENKDYSGVSVMLGVKYLMSSKKGEKDKSGEER